MAVVKLRKQKVKDEDYYSLTVPKLVGDMLREHSFFFKFDGNTLIYTISGASI